MRPKAENIYSLRKALSGIPLKDTFSALHGDCFIAETNYCGTCHFYWLNELWCGICGTLPSGSAPPTIAATVPRQSICDARVPKISEYGFEKMNELVCRPSGACYLTLSCHSFRCGPRCSVPEQLGDLLRTKLRKGRNAARYCGSQWGAEGWGAGPFSG